jgi:hypothetical protein
MLRLIRAFIERGNAMTDPDAALIALTDNFERSVIPEFERRRREIEQRRHDPIAADDELDKLVEWLNEFVTAIAEQRATTLDGLRAKARVGLGPVAGRDAARALENDEFDDTIIASILCDLLEPTASSAV